MTDVCDAGRFGRSVPMLLAAALFFAAAAGPVLAASPMVASPIVVQVDRARLIKLPERAATIVIGDPLIADLSIQSNGLAVITGKGYGATNVIVLDRSGAVLTEQTLQVEGPSDPTVVVYRGVDRETYSCTPQCSRRMTLGDDPDYFNKTLDQITTRSAQAIAAGTLAGGTGGSPGGGQITNPVSVNAPAPPQQQLNQRH